MRMHNNAERGSRQCWNTARERNRLKARFSIRERIFSSVPDDTMARHNTAQELNDTTATAPRHQATAVDSEAKSMIQSVLHRIIDGDRSFFSLQYMDANYATLNTPFPTDFLWTDDGSLLLGHQKMLSWFGTDGLNSFQQYILALCSCTFFEFSVWLKRYHIVGSLILGGLNPCLRGSRRGTRTQSHSLRNELEGEIGTAIGRLFFSGVVPLSLSSFIVKTSVDMRRFYWERSIRFEDANVNLENATSCCITCKNSSEETLFLAFGNTKQELMCSHLICENCFWRNIVDTLLLRTEEIFIGCPACSHQEDATCKPPLENLCLNRAEAAKRRQKSLSNYETLCVDAVQLRSSKVKKTNTHESKILCSSWKEAVKPSLGLSQSVRKDKFFFYVEKGSYHFVKGCLDFGINVDFQNDYGQTALFVSTWRGDADLVHLLLSNGSNPNLRSNGGISCLSVAIAQDQSRIVDMLREFDASDVCEDTRHADSLLQQPTNTQNPILTELIDWSSDAEGAGSFTIDNMLSSQLVDALIELWKSLPMHPSPKKKAGLCSDRSYFCDVNGWISNMISQSVRNCMNCDKAQVFVYPHMRFLCYSIPGTSLAPHQDLSRVEFRTGKRSTHSFLLYLTDCWTGGETCLLQSLSMGTDKTTLAVVQPRRGRLLLFPHRCPHEGLAVECPQKVLVRGEVYLSPT